MLFMLEIHDIKPLYNVPDYSIFIYYGLIILITMIFIFSLYLIYNYFQKRKNSKEKEYYKILCNLSFNNPKQDAYTISTYGRLLAKEERSQKLLNDLWEDLQIYKYKKDVPVSFSQETKAKFTTFMDSLDVR